MFSLLKLATYLLAGYAIYEFARGLLKVESTGTSGTAAGRQESDGGRQPNITGPGAGRRIRTADPDGMSTSHYVGRGVVASR